MMAASQHSRHESVRFSPLVMIVSVLAFGIKQFYEMVHFINAEVKVTKFEHFYDMNHTLTDRD
jgi:hypothetical protein